MMKYLKRFNESLEEDDWDLDEIKDIFQDIIDEGFSLDDVHIGSSLPISPKLWCNSHHDFSGNPFPSLSINFKSEYKNPKYDLSILDVLDECIKHFEKYYGVELESIYTVGLLTRRSVQWGFKNTIYNWFNSCETIKDINKAESKVDKLSLTRFHLTFKLTK